MVKAILFDFDGVIGLSEKNRFHVLQQSAVKHSVTLLDDSIANMVGRGTLEFLTETIDATQHSSIKNIIEDHETEFKGNITKYVDPIPATVEFIKKYNGDLLFAVASMSSQKVIYPLLKHFQIYEKFASIICKEEVEHKKPHPEIYLKSAQTLGVSPAECVVIEDTIVGVQAAINAKMSCFVLLNELNSEDQFKEMQIAGFIRSENDLIAIA